MPHVRLFPQQKQKINSFSTSNLTTTVETCLCCLTAFYSAYHNTIHFVKWRSVTINVNKVEEVNISERFTSNFSRHFAKYVNIVFSMVCGLF